MNGESKKIELRMDEFEKVTHEEKRQDIIQRMDEFEKVDKEKRKIKEKGSRLPYGIKYRKSCMLCGNFMELYELSKDKVIYRCKNCMKEYSYNIEEITKGNESSTE